MIYIPPLCLVCKAPQIVVSWDIMTKSPRNGRMFACGAWIDAGDPPVYERPCGRLPSKDPFWWSPAKIAALKKGNCPICRVRPLVYSLAHDTLCETGNYCGFEIDMQVFLHVVGVLGIEYPLIDGIRWPEQPKPKAKIKKIGAPPSRVFRKKGT